MQTKMDDRLLADVQARLIKINREIWGEYDSRNDGSVHHYTSFAGFKGLITSEDFWLTDMSTMKDAREFIYFGDVLKPIVSRKVVPKSVKDRILATEDLFSFGSAWFGYTMCFCHAADKASQWDQYADRAQGVAISFDHSKLVTGGANLNYSSVGVVYDPAIQAANAERLIDGAIQVSQDLGINEQDEFEYWFEVLLLLFECAARSKDPGYRSEEEVRIVLLSTDRSESKKRDDGRGGIRYYVEAPIPLSALNGVMIGPKSALTEEAIRGVLAMKGIDVPISRSRLTII
jgi:hypothetical protein